MILSRLANYFNILINRPLDLVILLLYQLLVISVSLSFHEYAHALVAYRCGDPTAKYMGRLTLDPRSHMTLTGMLALFFLGFGWGRPVPVDARNFKHQRRWLDDIAVSAAGIVTNFLLFLVSLILALVVNRFLFGGGLKGDAVASLVNPFTGSVAQLITYSSNITDIVNMAKYGMDNAWLLYIQRFLLLMASMNLTLAVFNLLPVPPLDGYRLLDSLVFRGRMRLSPNTMIIIQYTLLFLVVMGFLSGVLTTVCGAVYSGVLKLLLLISGQA